MEGMLEVDLMPRCGLSITSRSGSVQKSLAQFISFYASSEKYPKASKLLSRKLHTTYFTFELLHNAYGAILCVDSRTH